MAQDTDEVRCPRGHLTSAKFPFCTECGAELNPQEAEAGIVRCPNGHIVTGGHKFCIECGAPVEQDEAGPTELADTDGPSDDDTGISEVDEVRCPKGHLTPGEYPYCIICGAELEKGAAPAAAAPSPRAPAKGRPVRKTVRRRPRAAPPEMVEPDEPDEPVADVPLEPEPTETMEITPPSPRRAPRSRRAPRTPAPVEESALVDEPAPIVIDQPDEPDDELEDEPFLAPVPSYAATDTRDESAEHFVHTPGGKARERSTSPTTDDRQKLIAIVAIALFIIAAVVVFFLIKGRGNSPSAAPTIVPTTVPSAAATPAPTAAPAANANVPMLVTASSIRPGAGNTYLASASIRNPTDFVAKNITVTFELKDSTGAIVGAVKRTIASLASGQVAPITAQGTDPTSRRVTGVIVKAFAAQLTH